MSFQFKQFSIDDSNCAMKIGTDGCLLGSWADVAETKSILDIGTGSGVIALMLAQRSNAHINAVEIDDEAFKQSKQNFKDSPWGNRLSVTHSSIQEYIKGCEKKYDLIVCCPPYFVNSLKTTDKKRRLARHTDSLSFEELLSGSIRLLNEDGKFCTIIPADAVKLFCDLAPIEGFFVTKVTEVFPKEAAPAVRTLLQLERSRKKCFKDTVAILDKEGKSYTQEYKKLTGEFYINF
jgi:tRNA1Val (adenine37-N6)-methyltransferase